MSNREEQSKNRLNFAALAALALALASGGALAAWLSFRQVPSSQVKTPTTPITPTPAPSVSPSPSPAAPTETLTVYWLKVTPAKTELVPAQLSKPKDGTKASRLELALASLLEIPNDSDYSSFIPPGTKLLGVKEDSQGIHLNFSSEFATGEGTSLLIGRLGQVIYTATSQAPQSKVWIEVEGKPLELMGGGEGLLIEQPLTRQSFEENYQLN